MSKLYFRWSAMNAGKSTALLQIAFNYEERNMRVALYTAQVDDRIGSGVIGSRLGLKREAHTFGPVTAFTGESLFQDACFNDQGPVSCVLIDEAQFLSPEQVRQLHRFAHTASIPVICFGLRTDFRGNAFPGSGALLALADDLEEMKTICSCSKKATMNIRLDAEGNRIHHGEQIVIGGNATYRSVCADCFYKEAA